MKVVLCGPPHSGKSCLRQGLKDAIREIPDAPYPYVITANPDGEGAWFQETMRRDPVLAEEIKADYKSEFTSRFVQRAANAVQNYSEPFALVDIGGIPDEDNETICAGATHAVLLAGDSSRFKGVARFLRGGDRIVAERITGASMQEAQLPVDVTVPTFDLLTSNQIQHEQAMKKTRSKLKKGIPTLLEGESSKCTDIFGAFRLAGKVFQNARAGTTKRLLVASDMVETCGPNFKRRSLDSTDTAALIEAQRESGRLPDLTGVRVWVAGATATEKLSPERVQDIERFWLRYFEATGADLAPARYGPTLLGWS